jgi:hypothetical protein
MGVKMTVLDPIPILLALEVRIQLPVFAHVSKPIPLHLDRLAHVILDIL